VTARLISALAKLSPGMLWLLAIAIGGAVVLEAWVLVLRQPLTAYRELAAARDSLRAIDEMTVAQQQALERAAARHRELAERLNAELAVPATPEELTVSLMRKLDQRAAGAGIQLTSLKPAGRRQVLAFEESSFDVGAQGKYLALCHWLLAFEHSLGAFATVTDFTMRSSDGGKQVALSMRLALYRPLPHGEAIK
jgi:Tfp pilus assembly protein PilO